MKTGKKPKKLENVDKKEVNENEKVENKFCIKIFLFNFYYQGK